MNKIPITFLSAFMALVCAPSAFSQEEVKAPQSLDGASIRIKMADEKEIFCKADDLALSCTSRRVIRLSLSLPTLQRLGPREFVMKNFQEMDPTMRKRTKGRRPSSLSPPSKVPFTMSPWKATGPATIPLRLKPYRAWKSFSLRTYPSMGMRNVSNSSPRRKNLKSRNVPELVSRSESFEPSN